MEYSELDNCLIECG